MLLVMVVSKYNGNWIYGYSDCEQTYKKNKNVSRWESEKLNCLWQLIYTLYLGVGSKGICDCLEQECWSEKREKKFAQLLLVLLYKFCKNLSPSR